MALLTHKGIMSELDPQFKARWIKALRSGRYQQAQRTLRVKVPGAHPKYCCVGVACNLLDPKKWKATGYHFDWGDAPSSGVGDLPFLDAHTFSNLAVLNDEKDWDFKQIADWIEENL